MLFSRKQQEYIRKANSRWNIQVGAVRSGKSFVDIAHVIPERLRAVHDKDGLNVILGVSKESVERNVLQPMREIYTSALVGTINSRNIAQVCGVPVYCLGAEKASQVAKIQGASIKYCYGDEIAKWNREVFVMLASRLDKEYSKFDGACNPEYPTHWLKQFIDRDDIDKYVQRYTIFDNPFLPKSTIRNLCREYYGTVYYDRYILGLWALAEGLIYPMWQEAVGEPPEGEPDEYAISIDYGTQNAFAALLWGKFDAIWYAIDEYYYSGKKTGIQKTDDDYANDLEEFLPDTGRKIKTYIDPSAASMIALLQKKSRYRVIPAKNDVVPGIEETAVCMQRGIIRFSEKCINWKREVQGYVWDEKSNEDKPVKKEDHAVDAVRYFVRTKKLASIKREYKPVYSR